MDKVGDKSGDGKGSKARATDTIGYLTDGEYAELVKYKHYAEKTWYELFMLKNVTFAIEEHVIP